ncbi:MAG: hypothetical protein QOD39_4652 [Mycobacterium sp.]|nr:hypothetical protein [Mycobacterium sp.]
MRAADPRSAGRRKTIKTTLTAFICYRDPESMDQYSWLPPFDWTVAYENEHWRDVRPEPDPVDHATGRKVGGHRMLLSATSRHNMQLTQFSTSVPSNAICRNLM